VPVSELAILTGAVAPVVGVLQRAVTPMIVGVVVCTLGVVEVTAREHFSGYRSHATLLAAVPAATVGIVLVVVLGRPRNGAVLLLAVVPVFALLFWLLRKRFRTARQTRLARPPAR